MIVPNLLGRYTRMGTIEETHVELRREGLLVRLNCEYACGPGA